ncbi:non-hydrolyzing UDP-N-acetylglucosamine 2-epimerase [Flavobacterium litorale]|uniref:UDP-N-acetylglucosamine 2-epimerase (non-hydrolyzing) n=1 Tax=Flavobacterium litorale TaxID=2856519 RepID=A0ABX8VDE2_9FLAO|nr:UDP-N-acetylglucosamine 2-epimerase (non-hydrolyzing) [Flavobacterium litorale]QYJ69066.1 UDP-N-acetylglucosamine 2-epimerase (non-hydrolyzing) [Flavobacterium litorale]
MKKILFLFGTRPEAIKMAPLIRLFSQTSQFTVRVGITAQHREMLDQVLDFFEITTDYDLNVMVPNQTLHGLTATLIARITEDILLKEKFDLVFVQGDTTTVLAASLAAFYQKIQIAHIEAGLRSHDMHSPFPEEMNRALTTKLASFHFCPTEHAKQNLLQEGVTKNIYVTGNTVIDALLLGIKKVDTTALLKDFSTIDFSKKIILVTCHRRENFGAPFAAICKALVAIADKYKDSVEILYPVHPNPNVKAAAHELLVRDNIKLLKPLGYNELIWMMDKSSFILTDSGGIQEEAPSLGKPILVMREVTERTEGVAAGTAILVGADTEKIINEASALLDDANHYNSIAAATNPYGDGKASEKVVKVIKQHLLP